MPRRTVKALIGPWKYLRDVQDLQTVFKIAPLKGLRCCLLVGKEFPFHGEFCGLPPGSYRYQLIRQIACLYTGLPGMLEVGAGHQPIPDLERSL